MMKKTFFLLLCAVGLALTACNPDEPNASGENNGGNNGDEDVPTVKPIDKPDGCLNGVFSVSESKQVRFSMGNLQYTQSTDTWAFAEQQYDFIGTDNVEGGTVSSDTYGDNKKGTALADKIDLFGWSGSAGSAKWGIGTSTDYKDYSGDFVDWGQNAISNGGNKMSLWRTLTDSEWKYLLENRSDASSKYGIASINGVGGVILLPDDWQTSPDLCFKSGFPGEGNRRDVRVMDDYGSFQTFTCAEWQLLENAGAVFLPASGYRSGTKVSEACFVCCYRTATSLSECYGGIVYFSSLGSDLAYHPFALSVRLVQDVK